MGGLSHAEQPCAARGRGGQGRLCLHTAIILSSLHMSRHRMAAARLLQLSSSRPELFSLFSPCCRRRGGGELHMCTHESRPPCAEACSRCRRTAMSRLVFRDSCAAASHPHTQAQSCTDTARADGCICGRALLMQACTSAYQFGWARMCRTDIQEQEGSRRGRCRPAPAHIIPMCQHTPCRSRRAGGLTYGRTWHSCRGPTAQPQAVRPS